MGSSVCHRVQPGSRELNRIEIRRAIQRSAMILAVERGVDGVTVEDVCQRAHVSRRTFFNYFASKEAVYAGGVPSLPSEPDLAQFLSGGPSGDLFDDLCELFVKQAAEVVDDPEMHALRRAVLRENPHLLGLRYHTLRDFEDAMVDVVAERQCRADRGEATRDVDTLTTILAIAALRYAARAWTKGPPDILLEDCVRQSFADARHALAAEVARE